MNIIEGKVLLVLTVVVFLAVLIIEGCATTIKYSYDTEIRFPELKTYVWGSPSVDAKKDPLLETNVQVLADQLLSEKGFTRVSGNADLMMSISYEGEYKESYQLSTLTLNIYKMPNGNTAEKKELIWRGTALSTRFGNINTDAASGGLKKTIQGILSKFPPK